MLFALFTSFIEFMKYRWRTYEHLHVIFVEDAENFCKVFVICKIAIKVSHGYTKNFMTHVS